jgi:hypothetical protein
MGESWSMQSFTVQQEMQARLDEVDRLRKKQVERARYEADLCQRRYLHVDPANRLVADSLEATPTETGLEGGKYRQHGPSYVFSKLLTDSDNYWPGNQAADQFNRRLEKSIGQFDVTHNFKLGGVYDLPFGKGKQFPRPCATTL